MRLAFGPIAQHGTDDWPLVGYDTLASEGFEVVPFGPGEAPPPAEALIAWSIEYLDAATLATLRAAPSRVRCAVVGDWHVHDPAPDALRGFDLVAADLRYARAHPDVPGGGAIWFRQFSFDPRLHTSTDHETRDLDVVFMGRPTPHREGLCTRLRAWGHRPDRLVYVTLAPYQRGEEAHFYARAKIVLGDSQRGELQMRAYESMACGALYVCQHDTPEVFAGGAPIPTYDPREGNLEAFLEAWLADDAAREAMVARQRAWVAKESPARHLRFLCRAIQQRMVGHPPPASKPSRTRHAAQPEAIGPAVVDAVMQAAETPLTAEIGQHDQQDEPPRNEQRNEQRMEANNGHGVASAGVWAQPHDHQRGPGAMAVGDDAAPPLNEQRRECAALVPAEARRILDVGCHEGGFGHFLKQQQPARVVWGVDLSEPALAVAARRLDGVSTSVDLDGLWPAEPWNTPGAYDCIAALDILEHLTRPAVLLAKARRLLCQHGCVVASIPNLRNLGVLWDLVAAGRFPLFTPGRQPFEGPSSNTRCSGHIRFFCRSDVEAMFERAGYTIERWETTQLLAPSLERFYDDLCYLLATHGADVEAFKASAYVMQWMVVARPDWSVVAEPDALLPT